MGALCTEAARRKALRQRPGAQTFEKPLSAEFIRERADIDDPIIGYQVRRRAEGWLQGFGWYTTFTHWTESFKWDSLAVQAGLRRKSAKEGRVVDADGALAIDLEAEPRHCEGTDINVHGVMCPTVAELSIIGALGCGGYLLQLLLQDMEARGQHKYVVLQATENAVPFYEKYGFMRVGAVAQYAGVCSKTGKAQVMGYRHWISDAQSEMEGSFLEKPSYMMAKRLNQGRQGKIYREVGKHIAKKRPVVQPTEAAPARALKAGKAKGAAKGAGAKGAKTRKAKGLKVAKGVAKTRVAQPKQLGLRKRLKQVGSDIYWPNKVVMIKREEDNPSTKHVYWVVSEYDVKGDKCGLLGLEEHGNFGNHTTRAGRKRYRVASPRYQKARPVDASLLKLASANAVNKVSDLRKEVSVFAGRGGEGRGAVLPPFATRLCRGCRGTDARGPGVGPVDATDTTA